MKDDIIIVLTQNIKQVSEKETYIDNERMIHMRKLRKKPAQKLILPIGDEMYKNSMMDPAITALALDADKYPNAIDYVNLYLELLSVDRLSISNQAILASPYIAELKIADLEAMIKKIPDKKLQKRLKTFFNLDNTGRRHYLRTINEKDIATVQMAMDASEAQKYLTTIESMYVYSASMKDIVDKIARKVHGNADNVTKAKYAHVYYRFLSEGQFIPYYDDEKSKETTHVRRDGILSDIQMENETKMVSYQSIGMLIDEWSLFFSKMPDNNLIMELIEAMLKDLDSDDEEFIRKDAQLTKEAIKFQPTYREIREHKEHIFAKGEWLVNDFMRYDSLNEMYAKDIRELCKLYRKYKENYEWESEETVQMEVVIPSKGKIMVTIPTFGMKRFFKDEFEMIAFLNLMAYLKKEGFVYHNKALAKYDFFEILGM